MPTKQNNTKGMKGTARKCKEMNRYITESGHWDFQAGSNYVNTMRKLCEKASNDSPSLLGWATSLQLDQIPGNARKSKKWKGIKGNERKYKEMKEMKGNERN